MPLNTFHTMVTDLLQPSFEQYCYRGLNSSSPPSSAYSITMDSSPPSSPELYALELDDARHENDEHGEDAEADRRCTTPELRDPRRELSATHVDASPAHPFSASTHAAKRLPCYDKGVVRAKVKRLRPRNNLAEHDRDRDEGGYGSARPNPFAAGRRGGIYERDAYLHDSFPRMNMEMNDDGEKGGITRAYDPEHALWEETIAQAVDGAECKIDLSGHGLTYIPSRIADLSNLVVFHNNHISSLENAPRRMLSKKSTSSLVFGAGKLGMREDEIHLFLGNNKIKMLPNELFNLDALVMLSLRGNMLTELPPQICQLRNLRELNVANNHLQYLPSEIMSLRLTSLAVDPNPFVENPYAATKPRKHRWFSPVERKHTVVCLAELTLRVLLAPAFSGLPKTQTEKRRLKTVLETLYDLPLPTDYEISPALKEILTSCVPGSIPSLLPPNATPHSSPEVGRRCDQSAGPRACVSMCPSPVHLNMSADGRYYRPTFVVHAEERFSWEKEVAGQRVGGESGVPVRWRGCSAGCLDHLEIPPDADPEDAEEDWSKTRMDFDREEGVFVLRCDAVPSGGQFSSEGIDLDDL